MSAHTRNRLFNYLWGSSSDTSSETRDTTESEAEDVEPGTETSETTPAPERGTDNLAVLLEDPNSYEFTETIRDVMIQMVFYGFTERYVECYSKFVRKFIEYSLLLQACICFSLLCQIHYTYVQHPINCFPDLGNHLNSHTLVRIKITDNRNIFNLKLNSPKVFDEHYFKVVANLESLLLGSGEQNNDEDDDDEDGDVASRGEVKSELKKNLSMQCFPRMREHPTLPANQERLLRSMNRLLNLPYALCYYLFRLYINLNELIFFIKERKVTSVDFSTEEGLLFMQAPTINHLNITIINIHLNPLTNQCFGATTFRRVFMDEMFSSADVIMVSLERLLVQGGVGAGFYRLDSGGVERLLLPSDVDIKFYLLHVLKMLFFILFVSTILKNIYNSFLNIFVEVSTGLNFSLNAFINITMSFVAVYGLRHFTSKLARQHWVAVFVIFLIWFAEQYYCICCRTRLSRRYWPKFFYLYFFSFYTYYIHFNAKFRFLVLLTKWLFIQHSMFYFFHRFELPTIMNTFRRRLDDDTNNNNNNNNDDNNENNQNDDVDDNNDNDNNADDNVGGSSNDGDGDDDNDDITNNVSIINEDDDGDEVNNDDHINNDNDQYDNIDEKIIKKDSLNNIINNNNDNNKILSNISASNNLIIDNNNTF